MGESSSLAAEFFVLSQLHRAGYDATITLGHTKEIDIYFTNKKGNTISIDAKGLKGTTNFVINKIKRKKENHFYVFVCYRNKMGDLKEQPECYIVPSMELESLLSSWSGKPEVKCLGYRRIRDNARYKDGWNLLEK